MSAAAPCPVCGAAAIRQVAYPGKERASALGFDSIGICDGCGLGAARPTIAQEALDRFYATGSYWGHVADEGAPQLAHESNQARRRLLACLPHIPAAGTLRLLDVGAGHGMTVRWAQALLTDRVAGLDFIEPDERLAAQVLSRPAPFAVTRVRQPLAAERYDLVFANQVLEHVADPVAFMTSVRDALAPGGVAYVETPHSDYRFKSDVFPHVLFFTAAAMAGLAERSGLRTLTCESFGRNPGGGPADLACRAGFRLAAALGAEGASRLLDDALWRYGARSDGIWLRWIAARP